MCSTQRNPTTYLHKDFAHIRSMTSCRWPLFGPHSLTMNPSETRATAGGLKDQLRSPPSVATIGAAARRLGKVWQLKSIQGSVKHWPCVLRLTHQWGGGDRDGRERERNMFWVANEPKHWLWPSVGCEKKERKTSSRGDDDGTPRAFTTKQVSEGLGKKKLNISDNISTLNTWIPTNDKMYSLNWHPLLIWQQSKCLSLRGNSASVTMPLW